MAEFQEVELTNGETVRVYRSPTQRILAMVEAKDPEPVVPIVTETNVTGRSISMSVPTDPDYVQALKEWNERKPGRDDEIEQLEALFMLKDLKVPENWDIEVEVGEEARFFDPDWAPREGAMGRKLDYIQWVILGDSVNAYRIQNARAELSGIDMQEVQAVTASFRDQVEGSTD